MQQPQNPFRLISAACICSHILHFPTLRTITEGWKLHSKHPKICKNQPKKGEDGVNVLVSVKILYKSDPQTKSSGDDDCVQQISGANPSTVRVYLTFQQLFWKDNATPTLHMLHPAHRTGRYDLILKERVAATELPWVKQKRLWSLFPMSLLPVI